MIASLVERISHDQIAKLTPRQIMDHYFYPRNEKGELQPMDEEYAIPDEISDDDADAYALAFAEAFGADTEAIHETIRRREEMKAGGDSE